MESSILKRVRKFCTGTTSNNFFDDELIMGINAGFQILNQNGLGPEEGFMITDESNTWDEFTNDEVLLNTVEAYICRKAKMEFDPPTNSTLTESYNNSLAELEWRLKHAVEIQLAGD